MEDRRLKVWRSSHPSYLFALSRMFFHGVPFLRDPLFSSLRLRLSLSNRSWLYNHSSQLLAVISLSPLSALAKDSHVADEFDETWNFRSKTWERMCSINGSLARRLKSCILPLHIVDLIFNVDAFLRWSVLGLTRASSIVSARCQYTEPSR